MEVVQKPLVKLEKGADIYAAIIEVWEWHWENWENRRIFSNPFEAYIFDGKEKYTAVNNADLPETENDVSDETLGNFENASIISPSNNIRSELSNPNNFINILKENIITLIILIIAGVILSVVIYRNRKRNYENENDEKNM